MCALLADGRDNSKEHPQGPAESTSAQQQRREAEGEEGALPQEQQRECPICKMMREGGCKAEFDVRP